MPGQATTEVSAVETAPEPIETTATEAEVILPEEKTADAVKTFTQEEVDAIVGKTKAKERRKFEREHAQNAAKPVVNTVPLTPEQFATPDAYVDALAERKAEEKLAQREFQKQAEEIEQSFREREEKAIDKYSDYDQVVYRGSAEITKPMAEAIKCADNGPEIAYYLGTNAAESSRIARLSPISQVKEIGRLEAKLAAEPPVKKTSTAPAPISPVTPNGGSPKKDPSNPKDAAQMSQTEWFERRVAQKKAVFKAKLAH